MKKQVLYIITLFLLISPLFSQFQNIVVSSTNNPHEVSIMINPKNPNQVVIGSNIFYFGTDTSLSGYHYTTNGGLNWSSGILRSNVARPSGDPVILVDTSGYFHYLQNSNYAAIPNWWDRELIMKSTNGGMNWSNGEAIGFDSLTVQDKPWGCVDFSNSPYKNSIYVTWSRFSEYINPTPGDSSIIMFSKSANGSQYNWSSPVRISKLSGDAGDSSNTVEGAVPCTGPNGEIYVSWAGPKIRNQQYGIFFDRSTDGGISWLDNDIFVTEQPGGWDITISNLMRCNGFPVSACDISNGPYRGNIYINWSDQRNGINDCDIWFIKSTDGGNTWGQVKRVNNDPPGKQQFYNWMTIDQVTGYIYVIFYDQRSMPALSANVYLAQSTDGGETFENIKINSSPVTLYYGLYDYIGVSAYNGKIRPVWMGSNFSIITAIVDSFYNIGINTISTEIPKDFALKQNYPNPFNPVTYIEFDISEHSYVNIIIYDIAGREIEKLVNQKLAAGKYKTEWNAENFSSGVYYCKLESGGFMETKKLVLAK
jgi:hypothetical protein